MTTIKDTITIKNQFIKNFDNAMRSYFQENLKLYVNGKTRFIISIFAVILLIMLGFNSPFPVVAPIMVIILWFIYVLGSNQTRFFVTSISNMKNQIAKQINQLFRRSGINLHYSNQKQDSIKKDIKKLKLFTKYGVNVHYHYHNTLTGTLGDTDATIGNIDIVYKRENSGSRELFSGSVYVIPLKIDKNYYLRVIPERFHKRKTEIRLNGMDMTTLFKRKNKDENKKDIDYYDIVSNGEYATIIDEHITSLFKRPLSQTDFNFKKLFQKKGQCLAKTSKKLKNQIYEKRIEILVIKDSKAYIFFPFKYKGTDRKFPFDITNHKNINADYLWDNMQDILEKTSTLEHIVKNAQQL